MAGTIAVVFLRGEYGPVRNARTIIDIGANLGCFVLHAAACAPEARIVACEPEQRNFACLVGNIDSNRLRGRVEPRRVAIAAESGLCELLLNESPLHTVVRKDSDCCPGLPQATQSIETMTLTQLLDDAGLTTVDVLKMNCEGAEYEILYTTSIDVLRRVKALRLEYHNLDENARNGDALRVYLENLGLIVDRYTTYRGVSGFMWARWS